MKFTEFITRTQNISFAEAISLLLPVYVNAHNWNIDDSIEKVFENKRDYIINIVLIKNINDKVIVGEVVYDYIRDEDGFPYEDEVTGKPIYELKECKSYANAKNLFAYVINDINEPSYIPDAIIEFSGIKIETLDKKFELKYDQRIDKPVCQGIARTLWDIYPDTTLKDMSNHNAIQMYGNGRHYKDPKTVPGWLSEVDPRPEDKRRGPKKKNVSDEGED